MIAGIDLGGTQARVAVARSDGRIMATARAQTQSLGGPEGFVRWAAGTLERLARGQPFRCIGLAAPGPLDPTSGVILNPPNLAGWPPNVPLARLLAAALSAPVRMENDANLAALGEFRRGAGEDAGVQNMVYLTWSTGIGAGLILDGRLYVGSHGTAGEIGHIILEPEGPACGCGQHGCLEVFASGRGLERQTGRPAVEIFEDATRGGRESQLIVSRAARYVGLALVNLANLVDPGLVVIGGGVTRSWSLVRPLLMETIRSSPYLRAARRPRLLRSRLGDRVGVIGAVEWARTRN